MEQFIKLVYIISYIGIPNAQVGLHLASPGCFPPSSLGRASANHQGPLLLLVSTGGHSTNLVGGSRKTYKPRIYSSWCAQAPIAMRYANLA